MSTTNNEYDVARTNILSAYFTGTFRVMLLNNTYTFDKDDAVPNDLTGEIAAAGNYVAGGIVLAGLAVSEQDPNNRSIVDFNDVDLGAELTFRSAVIVKQVGGSPDGANDELVSFHGWASDQVTDTLKMGADGVLWGT